MSSSNSWNRRDFIARVTGWLAAAPVLGSSGLLFGRSGNIDAKPSTLAAKSKIIHRTLGKTGISLPIVSMGVMNADVPGLIPRSYELGIRHYDTAAVYQQGRNEEMVGSTIKQMGVRDKVTIATKVLRRGVGPGQTQSRTYSVAEVRDHFNETFAGSLKRLQMDYVDILYNHSADTEPEVHSEGALEAMTALKKEGKVRFLGVSSHQPEMALKEAIKLGVYDVVLIPINYTMANNRELIKTINEAANKGIGLVAMKTQAGGANRPDPKLGKPLTPASQTALLKWVLRHGSITTAIPGYTTYDQLEQNFSVASNLSYSPAEEDFLSDKKAIADAQFCQQCGKCRADCPFGVDIPVLMRSHMYAVQYSNRSLAADTIASIVAERSLTACKDCDLCQANCSNSVNIAGNIRHLKQLSPTLLAKAEAV